MPLPARENHSPTKMDSARNDIESATGVMKTNLSSMFENTTLVNEMDSKADDLKWSAQEF